MKPAVAEWVSKAEGDFLTGGRELRARKSPNYDAVCFHAQQCAEKYPKAVLQENDKKGSGTGGLRRGWYREEICEREVGSEVMERPPSAAKVVSRFAELSVILGQRRGQPSIDIKH